MKTKILVVLLMAICSVVLAQPMVGPITVVEKGDTPAHFVGVRKPELITICEYLKENITYPEKARNFFQYGINVTSFTILPSGDVANFEVINSVSGEIDKAVIRALKTTKGMWKPAVKNGKAVAQKYEVACRFELEEVDMNKCACSCYKQANKHFFNGNFKKALKHFDKVVTYCPFNTGVLYQRGVVKLKLGDKEGALKDFKRINELGYALADNYLETLKQGAE